MCNYKIFSCSDSLSTIEIFAVIGTILLSALIILTFIYIYNFIEDKIEDYKELKIKVKDLETKIKNNK